MEKVKIYMNSDYLNAYWVYSVNSAENGLEYIGYGRLKDVVSMCPIITNRKFVKGRIYTYTLLEVFHDKLKAVNAVNLWIKRLNNDKVPPMNLSIRFYNNNKRVECIETGQVFNSAAEVSREMGIPASALCNHLQQKPGFKSVKGFTFRYA